MQGTGLLAQPAEGLLMIANVVRVTLYCSKCIIKSGECFFFFFSFTYQKKKKIKGGISFLFDNHPPLFPLSILRVKSLIIISRKKKKVWNNYKERKKKEKEGKKNLVSSPPPF